MNKARIFYFSICWAFFLLGFHSNAIAQEENPARTEEEERPMTPIPPDLDEEAIENLPVEEVDTVSMLNPSNSVFYSAVLPGLGQAYNGSHWKIPLIYIGGAFVVFNVNNSNRRYSTALRNLYLITRDPTADLPFDENRYNRETQFYRRNRDYAIILGTFLYGLNILDAYVDAHLQDFEINDDLAVRVKPALIPVSGGPTGTGIALTLHFK